MKTLFKRTVRKLTITDVASGLGHDAGATADGCGASLDVTELTVTEMKCVAGAGDGVYRFEDEVP